MNFKKIILGSMILAVCMFSSGCSYLNGIQPNTAMRVSIKTVGELENVRSQNYAHYTKKLNDRRLRFYRDYADIKARALARAELEDVLSGDLVTELEVDLATKEAEFLSNLEAARIVMNNNLSVYDELIRLHEEAQGTAMLTQEALTAATAKVSSSFATAFDTEAIRALERKEYNRYMKAKTDMDIAAYAESLSTDEHIDTSVEAEVINLGEVSARRKF